MPMMTITPAGYAAVQEALRTGVKMQPLTFQVGTGSSYNPLSQLTGLTGSLLYEGAVDHVTVLNEDTASFSGLVPGYVQGTIGEVIVQLNGDAFALGVLAAAYEKVDGFLFRFHGFVQALGLGKAVDPNYNTTSPLPKRLTYEMLAEADLEVAPVLGVLSGQQAGTERGPSVVVKSSAHDEEARWLLVGGTLAYRGVPQSTTSSTFTFAAADYNGVGYAIAMVHVVAGAGKGQTRHLTDYDETTNTYTTATDFSPALDSTSVLELWSGVGPCYGVWNNACEAPLDYDPEDPLPTQLPDPDPLCEPAAPVPTTKPPTKPPTIIADGPPVLVGPPTPVYITPRLGVHFSDWPICAPFDEPGTFQPRAQLSPVTAGADNYWKNYPPVKGLVDRLRVANALSGDKVFADFFNPEIAATANYDRGSRYTPAFASEALISLPASCVRLQPQPIAGAEGTSINYIRSTRLAEGSYADIETAAPAALGLPSANTSSEMASGLNVGPRTLDSILVPAYHRLVVYENKNFRGRVLLDVTGPIAIVNYLSFSAAERANLEAAQVGSGFVTSASLFPTVRVTNTELLWWPLHDAVWRGPVGQATPARVRFVSTMRLAKADGTPQATDWLPEPNMRLWRGSCRIILL